VQNSTHTCLSLLHVRAHKKIKQGRAAAVCVPTEFKFKIKIIIIIDDIIFIY